MTVKMKRPVAAALMLLLLVTGCVPAGDSPDGKAGPGSHVTITFSTRTEGIFTNTSTEERRVGNASCLLSVPASSTGLQILEAAVLLACIEGYTLKTQNGLRMVQCIEEVCEAGPDTGIIPATHWFVFGRWAETYQSSGVDGFATASHGDEFTLDLRVMN